MIDTSSLRPTTEWHKLVAALVYPILYEVDPLKAVDRVIEIVRRDNPLGATASEFVLAIDAAIASSEDLSTILPSPVPRNSEAICSYLQAIRGRASELNLAAKVVLTLPPEERVRLQHNPPYVTHQLLQCGPQIMAKPTSCFIGIRKDGLLRAGMGIFGKPTRSFDNTGSAMAAPEGMVFGVFFTRDGRIFDWGWIEEDVNTSGRPKGWKERFAEEIPPPAELTMAPLAHVHPGVLRTDRAWFSPIGDAIFCFFGDSTSYAEFVDDKITVFRSLDEHRRLVGVKLKGVLQLLEAGGQEITIEIRIAEERPLAKAPHTKLEPLLKTMLRGDLCQEIQTGGMMAQVSNSFIQFPPAAIINQLNWAAER